MVIELPGTQTGKELAPCIYCFQSQLNKLIRETETFFTDFSGFQYFLG